jgi:hypothetical protein
LNRPICWEIYPPQNSISGGRQYTISIANLKPVFFKADSCCDGFSGS